MREVRDSLVTGDTGDADLLPVLANRSHNIKREGEGAPSIFERDQRRRAVPHRVQKRFQFGVQRFFGSHWRLGDFNLRIHRRSS